MKKNRVLQLAVIANLTALSVLFYFILKFPLPFIFPSFLDIQFSNLPAILGGFALGPIAGSTIVIARTLIKLPFSSTAFVGEFIDLIIGLSTVLVSSIIYLKNRTRKGAIIAMIAGIFTWVFVAVLTNYLFVLDFYIEFYFNGEVAPLVGMMSVIPGITVDNYMEKFILYAAIPFNLLLATLVYGITFIIYKRISKLLDELEDRFSQK
ncbi:MAG: ECF transporter S component [Candidatus Izimaplasma sp.]|nr:ECF transporter S component [Candidatus Izimaplasma bacterium]